MWWSDLCLENLGGFFSPEILTRISWENHREMSRGGTPWHWDRSQKSGFNPWNNTMGRQHVQHRLRFEILFFNMIWTWFSILMDWIICETKYYLAFPSGNLTIASHWNMISCSRWWPYNCCFIWWECLCLGCLSVWPTRAINYSRLANW